MTARTTLDAANRDLLSALITASGLSISEFARVVVGRDERTVRRWLTGETVIPEQAGDWLARCAVDKVRGGFVTLTVQR